MRIQTLLQFIVPLAFLGIWGLSRLSRQGHRPSPSRRARKPVLSDGDLPPRRFRFTIRGLMLANLPLAILLSLPLRISIPMAFVAIWALTWHITRDGQPLPPRPTRAPSRCPAEVLWDLPGEPVHEGSPKPASDPFGDL